jgi:heat shock protein 4
MVGEASRIPIIC